MKKLQAAGLDVTTLPCWKEYPDVAADVEWVIGAFWTLSPSRSFTGLGPPSPIPFEVIDRYATRFEIDDFEEFHQLIRAIDAAWLEGFRKDG